MADHGTRDRSLLIAVISAVSVIAAAVVGALATFWGSGSGSGPSSPSGSSTVTTPATDPVERLLSFLPQDTVSNCSPTDLPFGALARVKCKATPQAGQVDTDIYFALYDGTAASRNAFDQSVPDFVPVSSRVCPDAPDRSDYNLPGNSKAGQLACYIDKSNGAPYVLWSRDKPGILGEAVAPAGTEMQRLWDVWLRVPINFSPSPTSVASTTE